jgi:hypothetical protein
MARLRISYKTDELEHLLEARIRQGEYEIDSRLPTERELSQELSVARGTIRKAYRALHHKGIVKYFKRSYYVNAINEPYEFEEKNADTYGIFFSKKNTHDSLLNEVETSLRDKGLIAISFNLDATDPLKKDFSLFEIIHTRLKGAFFLTNHIGNNEMLSEDIVGKLPFPCIFVGVYPTFKKKSYIKINGDLLIEKCSEYLEKENVRSVHLLWPWPIEREHGEWLSKLSKLFYSLDLRCELSVNNKNFKSEDIHSDIIICTGQNYHEIKHLNKEILVLGDCEYGPKNSIQVPQSDTITNSINLMINQLTHLDEKVPQSVSLEPTISIKV